MKNKMIIKNLGYASWAVPVSLWDSRDLGFVTVSVTAFVAAITQQEKIFIITFLAHLAILKNTGASIKNKCRFHAWIFS